MPLILQNDGEKPRGHLFAGGDNGVIFAPDRESLRPPCTRRRAHWSCRPWRRPRPQCHGLRPASRATWRATLRMRSMFATEVPPNFITRRAIGSKAPPSRGGILYLEIQESRNSTAPPPGGPAQTCKCRHIKSMEFSHGKPKSSTTIDRRSGGGRPFRPAKRAMVGSGWPDAALHNFNPVRVAYLSELSGRHFLLDGMPRDRHSPARSRA